MPIDAEWIAGRLVMLIPLWLSLSVHEWAHASAAWRLGDDTAALMGRLTLNPLAHIDPVGTLLLPLLGIPFGWAKPVPVQPTRFRARVSMRMGMMIVAIAGPISNLCLATMALVVLAILARVHADMVMPGQAARMLLETVIYLNVLLAVFNALPIPPLDGSRVADALMPDALRPAWEGFCQLGPVALAAVIILPAVLGASLFAWPLEAVRFLIHWLTL